jgi:glycosyltransferase involved in cell wall biosynthesis
MAAGTPVVTTCFGGANDLVEDGHTGIIVNPFNTESLTDALRTLLEDDALRAQYGENAKHRVCEEFDLESTADAYLSVMQDLVYESGSSVASTGD